MKPLHPLITATEARKISGEARRAATPESHQEIYAVISEAAHKGQTRAVLPHECRLHSKMIADLYSNGYNIEFGQNSPPATYVVWGI